MPLDFKNPQSLLPSNYGRVDLDSKAAWVNCALKELGFYSIRHTFNWDDARGALESFNAASIVQVIGLAQILAENRPLTVRGAMYRGIGRLWPDSTEDSYRKCCNLCLKMRRLGLIPYAWIVDGTRAWDKPSSWSGLADYAETVARCYRKDLWARQEDYVEIFVEKDAMSGIVRPVTREYDVRLNPVRGFGSDTYIWEVAQEWKKIDKPIFCYYLGDHDPSGLKIEEDLHKRLTEYSDKTVFWTRIAITEDDFGREDLLGMPVKKNGPSAKWQPYLDKFGDRCVEVDAIPATEIRDRIQMQIETHIDQREWEVLKAQEEREKEDVLTMIRNLGKESN